MMQIGFRIGNFNGETPSRFPGTVDIGDCLVSLEYFNEGGLWGWGSNLNYNIGDGTLGDSRSSPVQTIVKGTTWKQINISPTHTAAIKTDGTLWLWGANSVGQLGINTVIDKSTPVQTIALGNNWKQAAVGTYVSAAIKTNGELWTWGGILYGALGTNDTTNRSSPVQTVCLGTNWKQISVTGRTMAAIKTDGTLWAWGDSTGGILGDGSYISKSSPSQVLGTTWKQVSIYQTGTAAAIKTDGSLWAWGINSTGQFGNNNSASTNSPVQAFLNNTNWKQVVVAGGHIAAINKDGTLWASGDNTVGQLGDNSRTNTHNPVQTIAVGNNWKQVSGGHDYTMAIKTDGTLWVWGGNDYGQLGNNTINHKSSPVQTIAGGDNWKLVSCNYHTSFAAKDDIT